jgi:hypothetical protein
VRSFIGIVGYYRIFIEGFSKIAHKIRSLKKKGVIFEWTYDCERRFQQLKSLLTSTPILKFFYPNAYFIMCTNACKEELGGIVSQNAHVI